jgi:hypothetical protein
MWDADVDLARDALAVLAERTDAGLDRVDARRRLREHTGWFRDRQESVVFKENLDVGC